MKTATEFLDRTDADVVRIADSKISQVAVATTTTQEVMESQGPRRRSVLQRATVKTSQEGTADSVKANQNGTIRVQTSPD